MSEKHSKASRKRMLSIPVDERKKLMSELAKKRWAKTPKNKRKAHAVMMVKARIKK